MKNLKIMLFMMIILMINVVQAQDRLITGKVTSATTGNALQGVNVTKKGSKTGTLTDHQGDFSITASSSEILVFKAVGYMVQEIKIGSKTVINVQMVGNVVPVAEEISADLEVIMPVRPREHKMYDRGAATQQYNMQNKQSYPAMHYPGESQNWNTEGYATIHDNIFHDPANAPLSTFSIDVDAASYSNVRRFLNNGQKPPKDAVRIEELINYFSYDYKQPKGDVPFAVITEVGPAPWSRNHRLVHIGLQGKKIPVEDLPTSNIVFLLDVSGSMNAPNKLPLLKSAFKLLVNQLREEDHVSIVVYAGAAGLVLEPTSGADKQKILESLNNLRAGGSTAGGAGIKLAYSIARENFVEGGNNRIVLATDGDFNIGASSDAEMERLIEKERESGVFLTVLGFGMGNYKDSKMETLADRGNGNYSYIDNIHEAKKVLVSEFGGTMFTIAKDVKIQVEFNPALVRSYRLIGYENRMLKSEDFNNDRKDAGELGSGHTVTALYEVVLISSGEPGYGSVDPLKYQRPQRNEMAANSNELMTVKLRYKMPAGHTSKLISQVIKDSKTDLDRTSDNFRWSAAVAEFGMLLRDSEFKGTASYAEVLTLARLARGKDKEGYRAEFIKMVNAGGLLAQR
jgi:Ca-activated chloride channel family protein